MNNLSPAKDAAAAQAAQLVQDGMVLGLGTGSTADLFLNHVAARSQEEGLKLQAVPSSEVTASRATELNIPLISLASDPTVDLTVDGADEIDPYLNLIKGGGGALVREKILAWRTDGTYVVIADDSKTVLRLGRFPLPVAVLPFGWEATMTELTEKGCSAELRGQQSGNPVVTDDGLYVLDCAFESIEDPQVLEAVLEEIPGVIACGLFCGLADFALLGSADGSVRQVDPG